MESRQPAFQIKEQNFSGVTSLYRCSPHRTYVVEVELKKRIRGDMLQEAVDQTLQRMPYFADALTEKDGDFFYAVNPLPMEVAEKLCDKIAIIRGGKLLASGDIESVKGNESLEEVFLELVDDMKIDDGQAQEGEKNA